MTIFSYIIKYMTDPFLSIDFDRISKLFRHPREKPKSKFADSDPLIIRNWGSFTRIRIKGRHPTGGSVRGPTLLETLTVVPLLIP